MSGVLEGKVALVTGAGRGIGLAVAQAFAAEGATLVLSDLDASTAQAAAESLGSGHEGVGCDVRDEEAVASFVATAIERHGRVDVAVANAGVGFAQPVVEMSLADWRRTTSVNLDGVFLLLRHAGLAMAAAGSGSLITMASATASGGSPLIAPYAAAKAGAVNLTQTVAVELRAAGVRANAICPGFVDTELVTTQKAAFEAGLGLESFDAVIEAKQGRYGTVEEVARLAVFLASERSSFCTAGAYYIDGGLTASLL